MIRDGSATGPENAITDVPGVSVGHHDLRGEDVVTGVTAVIPHPGDLFRLKPRAAVEVINGFGKSVGLTQIAEMGTIETPILLTNTFGVSACAEALIRRAIAGNPAIGRTTSTVNPLVCECNDGRINDIQALAVAEADAHAALAAAQDEKVAQGAVGAGSGMTAFGFRGGVGMASRRLDAGAGDHVLGALVLANFGAPGDLTLPDGRRPAPRARETAGGQFQERGSVIVILGTSLPLGDRQLQRVARRAGAGLARLGAFWGNGSGDIALCFTTADPVEHDPAAPFAPQARLSDALIDIVFRAAAEATQEAALNAMCMSPATIGREGGVIPSLADWLKEHPV